MDEKFEPKSREIFLTKKILDAQNLIERNKAHINPVFYTELMSILERRYIATLEELEEICEQHK